MKNTMLLFGTAGIPRSTPKGDIISGLARIKELGLEVLELEFVHGVNLSPELARRIRAEKERLGIHLTVHAPYFINLNSPDRPKYEASIKRIVDSARIGFLAGAESVTFHAGFYLGQEAPIVYDNIKEAFQKIIDKLNTEKINIRLSPELTGKPSQFGSLEELISLSNELPNVRLCLDISHLHSRTNGKYNSLAEFNSIWKNIQKRLGKDALNNMHIHISGIKYSAKGEREHLNLNDSDFNYRDFIKSLHEYGVGGFVICESPSLEGDTLLLRKYYYKDNI